VEDGLRWTGWLEVDTPLQDVGLTSESALKAAAMASGPDVALKPM
jgi:saccharopine dehydrogenase-like NADP-dependent oxidoreductase